LKGFKFIFLLLCFSFFVKAVDSPLNTSPGTIARNESRLNKIEKYQDVIKAPDFKLSKLKRSKKPKGINVIVPSVLDDAFHKFHDYSDLTLSAVKGSYSLSLDYSHGKRGPPSRLG